MYFILRQKLNYCGKILEKYETESVENAEMALGRMERREKAMYDKGLKRPPVISYTIELLEDGVIRYKRKAENIEIAEMCLASLEKVRQAKEEGKKYGYSFIVPGNERLMRFYDDRK